MSLTCGYIGKDEHMHTLFEMWNAYMKIHSDFPCLVKYPTEIHQLHERLSEMVYHDRIAYIVASHLQSAVAPLLDTSDSQRPNFIVQVNGVLSGYTIPLTLESITNLLKGRILQENTV